MATGIIPIDKPQDWTSQDVAARLRRVFGTRRHWPRRDSGPHGNRGSAHLCGQGHPGSGVF